jgi:hypothetical protein
MRVWVMLWGVFGGVLLLMLTLLGLLGIALVIKVGLRGSRVVGPLKSARFIERLFASPKGGIGGFHGFGVEVRRAAMLTPTEARFFHVLRLALPPGTYVLAKVRLRDLFQFNDRSKEGFSFNNKCSQKHADFVVVREPDHLPLVVIELDDWTHGRARARQRDGVKDAMCAHAGLPMLRVQAGGYYNEAALNGEIRKAIAGDGVGLRVG